MNSYLATNKFKMPLPLPLHRIIEMLIMFILAERHYLRDSRPYISRYMNAIHVGGSHVMTTGLLTL